MADAASYGTLTHSPFFSCLLLIKRLQKLSSPDSLAAERAM